MFASLSFSTIFPVLAVEYFLDLPAVALSIPQESPKVMLAIHPGTFQIRQAGRPYNTYNEPESPCNARNFLLEKEIRWYGIHAIEKLEQQLWLPLVLHG